LILTNIEMLADTEDEYGLRLTLLIVRPLLRYSGLRAYPKIS